MNQEILDDYSKNEQRMIDLIAKTDNQELMDAFLDFQNIREKAWKHFIELLESSPTPKQEDEYKIALQWYKQGIEDAGESIGDGIDADFYDQYGEQFKLK